MNISVHILTFVKIIVKKFLSILLIPLKLFLRINKKVKCIVCINFKKIWSKSKKKVEN